MSERLQTGAIAQALKAEGSAIVWGEVMGGLHRDHNHHMAALALHSLSVYDGTRQSLDDSLAAHKMSEAGVVVSGLDRVDEGGDQLHIYGADDLERISRFVAGKNVLALLEEYPLDVVVGLLDPSDVPPVVVDLYRSGMFKSPYDIELLKMGIQRGTIAGCTVDANASRDAYVERGIPAGKITVIHNGVDIDKFVPSSIERAAFRERLAIPLDAPAVLFVGRYSPEKDVPLFMQSANLYLQMDRSAHIVMVGAGLSEDNADMVTMMQELVIDDELKSRIHLRGVNRDLQPFYAACDVLALTSATESRPLCITEAQAAGLGVTVTTEVGDAPIMVGSHGFVTGRDPFEIASRWIEAHAKRQEIGYPLARRGELGTAPMIAKYDRVLRQAAA